MEPRDKEAILTHHTIWFVIVAYKPNAEVLRRLVAALDEKYQVVTIDNTENNIGYGAAANQGMKKAFEAGAMWVVVVNQDVVLTRKGITPFCAMVQKSAPVIMGPEAGTLDPKRWTTVLYENQIELHKATPCKCQGSGLGEQVYISGSLMAIHKEVWEATGGFYEPYFMYYEDADLSIRARYAGFPLRQMDLNGFRHHAINTKKNDKEYYLARNHLLFVRRLAPLSVKIHELLRLPKSIADHHANTNREALKGVADFVRSMFGKRKQIS